MNAFELYSTGKYGYADIARLLNDNRYRSKTGRMFSKDTIRDILRNQIYIGKVRYQETRRNADGKRNFSAPTQWFDGKHKPVIDLALFERCQNIRDDRSTHHQDPSVFNPYLLRGLIYCHRCRSHPPANVDFPSWGKMICQMQTPSKKTYYRCGSKWMGLEYQCQQGGVRTETIDVQVKSILMNLQPPEDWRTRIVNTVSDILGEKSLQIRLSDRATIERMDFRWDNGFITDKVGYLEKRLKLQQELERLTPVHDDLEIAADMLNNFKTHWDNCENDLNRQHQLVKLIVDRVYVEKVVAITMKSNYHMVLGHNANEPTQHEVDPYICE